MVTPTPKPTVKPDFTRLQYWFDALLLIFLLVTFSINIEPFMHSFNNRVDDFQIHYNVATLALDNKVESAYNPDKFGIYIIDKCAMCQAEKKYPERIIGYFYPPTSILLTLPLGKLEMLPSFLVFFGAGLLFFSLFAWRLLGWRGLAVVLVSPALWMCYLSGQNGLLTASILAWSVWLLEKRPWAAGAVLSLALLKPQIAISLPAALYVSQHKKMFWITGLFSAFIIINSMLALPEAWQAAARYSSTEIGKILNTGDFFVNVRFSSVYAACRRLGTGAPAAFIIHAIIAVSVIFAHIWVYKNTKRVELRLIATACAALLIPPLGYDYDQPIGLIALLALLRLDRQSPLPWFLRVLIGISYSLIFIRTIDPYFGHIMSLVAWGNILLLLSALYLTQQQTQTAHSLAHKEVPLNR